MRFIVILGFTFFSNLQFAAEINRYLSAEIDPLAPVAAAYQSQTGQRASMWGGQVDFNFMGKFSTGPEIWAGNFAKKSSGGTVGGYLRKEELQPGEEYKLNAIRLRWNVTYWEVPETMRGLFAKAGVSYLRVENKSTKQNDLKLNINGLEPNNIKSDVNEVRSGVSLGFGQRWAYMERSLSVTLGMHYLVPFQRDITLESDDPQAKADYEDTIESIQDSRLSARPMPEAQLTLGYLW